MKLRSQNLNFFLLCLPFKNIIYIVLFVMENEKKVLTKEEKQKEAWRAVKFTLFSMSAGVIEFLSFTLLCLIPVFKELYWPAATISLLLSVIWNFTLNREFTFKSANNVPVAMLKTLAYYVVFGPLSIWLATMYLINTLGWNEFLVKLIVMLVNFVTEFLYQRFFVFGKSIDTKETKTKKEKEEVAE